MALKQKLLYHLLESFSGCRFYSSRMNWDELRPFILERIKRRNYPVRAMIPVAYDVVKARALLIEGVSALIRFIPIKACKFCPELFIGDNGHLIQTCHGPRRRAKNQEHTWITGTLNDILVPVESFHLQGVSQDAIKHDQRFDIDHFPAILELCCHAGANVYDESLYNHSSTPDYTKNDTVFLESLSRHELTLVARLTLEAWERLRAGVEKLLLVYPAKVCKCCSEVHIGPSSHKIRRLHGVFKYEGRQGTHLWKKAKVDDLVPPKVIWRQRSQDPPVLLDTGRDFYGCAPAVIELCLQAGASVPAKYFCMMKTQGLPPPPHEHST